jgi:hypothetical protein
MTVLLVVQAAAHTGTLMLLQAGLAILLAHLLRVAMVLLLLLIKVLLGVQTMLLGREAQLLVAVEAREVRGVVQPALLLFPPVALLVELDKHLLSQALL